MHFRFLFLLWKILARSAIISRSSAGFLTRGSNYYGHNLLNLIIGACFLGFGGFLMMRNQAFSPFLEQKEHKNLLGYEIFAMLICLSLGILLAAMAGFRVFIEQMPVFG